jgi:hypothetical protein
MIGNLTPEVVTGLVAHQPEGLDVGTEVGGNDPDCEAPVAQRAPAQGGSRRLRRSGRRPRPRHAAIRIALSTTLILRSIAEIARQEGENLAGPEAALACVQVFALGSGREDANPAESSYFAVRAALAQSMAEAAHFITEHGFVGQGAPVMIRLASDIATRFGLVVSQKVAAQAMPVIGALGGVAVNVAFMDHYQDLARAHFTVRRLERIYGQEMVRLVYDDIRQSAGSPAPPDEELANLPRP